MALVKDIFKTVIQYGGASINVPYPNVSFMYYMFDSSYDIRITIVCNKLKDGYSEFYTNRAPTNDNEKDTNNIDWILAKLYND